MKILYQVQQHAGVSALQAAEPCSVGNRPLHKNFLFLSVPTLPLIQVSYIELYMHINIDNQGTRGTFRKIEENSGAHLRYVHRKQLPTQDKMCNRMYMDVFRLRYVTRGQMLTRYY